MVTAKLHPANKVMSNQVVIVDYGMGNLSSVKKKLRRLKVEPLVSSEPQELLAADKIVLPGVGHFGKAMENLATLNLVEALAESVLERRTPILGICLGMQLMTKRSEEGDAEGLGWFDAEVVRFQVEDRLKYKVPHMGWNQNHNAKQSVLTEGLADSAEFYFVHSYHVRANQREDVLSETDYEYRFASAIEKENIFGVQYHPEKSHDAGEALLQNFLKA